VSNFKPKKKKKKNLGVLVTWIGEFKKVMSKLEPKVGSYLVQMQF
jgi:hypothetical protein